MYSTINQFNKAPWEQVVSELMVCAPIGAWAESLADRRPFDSLQDLSVAADQSARLWSDDEVLAAIATHASLGRKPKGEDANSAHSRTEQSALGSADASVQERLLDLQDEYRQRFGHIFLIRAAGRSAEDILAALEERLERTPEEEIRTAASELQEIAVLRLQHLFA